MKKINVEDLEVGKLIILQAGNKMYSILLNILGEKRSLKKYLFFHQKSSQEKYILKKLSHMIEYIEREIVHKNITVVVSGQDFTACLII